jgi:hypothetical protein
MLLTAAPLALRAQQVAEPQSASILEYRVKAAYLLNFTRFAEWPSAAFPAHDTAITICVIGEDPFGAILDRTIAGETVGGRALRVQRVVPEGNLRICHVAFISLSERDAFARILASLRGSPVLTVSEMPGFSQDGGMIEFILQEGNVRFHIQAAAAQAAGLTLSSRLLRVAVPQSGPQR